REWLQVTLLATSVTRLLAPDIFYFGNLPGETGDVAGAADVDGDDFFLTRAAAQDAPASVTNRFDFDRNGRVDVRDLAVIRSAIGRPTLPLSGWLAADAPFTLTSGLRRRCLVPADGFYEWQKLEGCKRKQPHLIRLKGDRPFAFAGLWDTWRRGDEPLESFTILTTSPNELVRPIHDRMPVIISPADFERWLDPKVHASGVA